MSNRTLKSTYETYLDRILENSEFVVYDQNSKTSLGQLLQTVESNENRLQFFLPKSEINQISKNHDIKKAVIQFFVENNKVHIQKLKEDGLVNIVELESMPFQFVLTKSKSESKPQKALIIFSNIHAMGLESGTFGFESTDYKIISNLIAIYQASAKGQAQRKLANESKYIALNKFQKLFDFSLGKRPTCIFLKYKHIPEVINQTEFYEVVPKSDISAAVNFRNIFHSAIDAYPETKYQKDEIISTILDCKSASTYIIIGLFGGNDRPETIAEWLSKQAGSKFRLYRKNDIQPKNLIEICTSFTNKVNYNEIWPENNRKDYAIIAKMRIEKATFIICGGCNHFGTERIGEYFENHWQSLCDLPDDSDVELRIGDHPFLILFDVSEDTTGVRRMHTLVLPNHNA